MIHISTQNNTFYLRAAGKLNKEDYDELLPKLKAGIEKYGKINCYFEMQDFNGWTPETLFRDLKFDLKHKDDLNRMAVVGNKKWQKFMSEAANVLTSGEIRYFDPHEKEKAKDWMSKT